MLLALLSPLLGALVNVIPGVLNLWGKSQDYAHEIAIEKLRMDMAVQAAQLNIDLTEAKADANEGESLRSHDSELDGGRIINALRASIRPVITYIFFAMFVLIKASAAYVMLRNGMEIPAMLSAIWDQETVALFGAIMGFWFGSRTIERLSGNITGRGMGFQVNVTNRNVTNKKK